jgi:hypothetical protein
MCLVPGVDITMTQASPSLTGEVVVALKPSTISHANYSKLLRRLLGGKSTKVSKHGVNERRKTYVSPGKWKEKVWKDELIGSVYHVSRDVWPEVEQMLMGELGLKQGVNYVVLSAPA